MILSRPGLQLIAIAALHTLVGVLLGAPVLHATVTDGWIGAVDGHFDRMAIFWFLWFGFALGLLGFAADHQPPNRALAAGIALLCLGGVSAMPASGFWLGFLPAVLLAYQAHTRP